jgi:phenylalanyl-tRNA synthetase alpha chain
MSAGELDSLKTELLDAIARASDLGKLEEVRIRALGRKGRVSELMAGLGALPPDERKSYGQAVNSLKASVSEALEAKRGMLAGAALGAKLAAERADVTLPVRDGPLAEGRIHPVSQVTDEITEIFADMGFGVAEGPDIETDFNNFTALNISARIRARCRSGPCSERSRRFASSRRAASIVATPTRPIRRCSIRSRGW